MSDFTVLERMVRDHVGSNVTNGAGGVSTVRAVIDYLRLLVSDDDDVLMFSLQNRGETNTGKLFLVAQNTAVHVSYGRSTDGRSAFQIEGVAVPLSSLVSVSVLPASAVWVDGIGTHSLDPSIGIEFAGGLSVTVGRDAEFGWSPWGSGASEQVEAARDALLSRLRF